MDPDHDDSPHVLQRWFSVGDILSLVGMFIALGSVYGSLSQRLERVQQDVSELATRDITPGARAELARVAAKDVAQDAAIIEMRLDMRQQRQEILESLGRLENKLDQHDGGR